MYWRVGALEPAIEPNKLVFIQPTRPDDLWRGGSAAAKQYDNRAQISCPRHKPRVCSR